MCNTVECNTCWYTAETVGAVPNSSPERLFTSLPPRGGDQDETGVEARLENTKKESTSCQASESFTRASSGQDNTPADKVDGDVLAIWISLHKVIGWILSNEVTNVKDTNKKTELLTGKMSLLDQTVSGSLSDGLEVILSAKFDVVELKMHTNLSTN